MGTITTWKCDVCGYIHEGDEPPETCPICGVGREMFSPMEISATNEPRSSGSWRCSVCDHLHDGEEPPEACSVCGATQSLFRPVQEEPHRAAKNEGIERIVIIGAGIAGLTAAEKIKHLAPEIAVTMLSKETGLPYYRLNLTRLLAEEITEESLVMHSEAWFAERGIELIEGEAVAIDRKQHKIRLHDGRSLPYDRLILANGSHAFVPPIPGVTRDGVMVLRTLVDAQTMMSRTYPGLRCACVGGGLLGLETAGALAKRGVQTTVLEGFGWLLPRQLPEPAGHLLRRHLEGIGLDVRCNIQVKEILGDERVRGVRLAEGDVIPADLVVLATGVRANSYLARQNGLTVRSGVVVDDHMTTSDPDIFAAGDVAEHGGVVFGIWPTAYAQGAVAGVNAAGAEAAFSGIPPSNRLKVLDVDLVSIGQFEPPDASFQLLEGGEDWTYSRLVCHDGRLVGAVLYGDTKHARLIGNAIENGTPILELQEVVRDIPELSGLCSQV